MSNDFSWTNLNQGTCPECGFSPGHALGCSRGSLAPTSIFDLRHDPALAQLRADMNAAHYDPQPIGDEEVIALRRRLTDPPWKALTAQVDAETVLDILSRLDAAEGRLAVLEPVARAAVRHQAEIEVINAMTRDGRLPRPRGDQEYHAAARSAYKPLYEALMALPPAIRAALAPAE